MKGIATLVLGRPLVVIKYVAEATKMEGLDRMKARKAVEIKGLNDEAFLKLKETLFRIKNSRAVNA